MESYLLENFGSSKQLKSSSEALHRWRRAAAVVRNHKRRREKLRAAVLTSKAALPFITALSGETKAEGFQICADELQSIVDGHNFKKLAFHGGVEGIANKLSTSTTNGLDATEQPLVARQKFYGFDNFPKDEKRLKGFIYAALHRKTTFIIPAVFILVSLIGTYAGGWPKGAHNGFAVIASILLAMFVTKMTDCQHCSNHKDLDMGEKRTSVMVTRNGNQQMISVCDLLPGDVVHLETGDQVPADGLFISGNSLLVDESNVMGKNDHPFLLSDTRIKDGFCKMLVTAIGRRTRGGKLARRGPEELLKIRKLGCFFLFMTFIVFVRGIVCNKFGSYQSWNRDTLEMLEDFAAAIAIVIAAVPDALPLAVTMSLNIAMERMLSTKDLVYPLDPCWTRESDAEVITTYRKPDFKKCDTLADGRSSNKGPVSDKKNMDNLDEVIAKIKVAKERANVIILADDFSTIVSGVKWCCSDYILIIQNVVEFQLNVNVASVIINLCCACLTGSIPLTAVQLLWVNMLMDTFWALAFITLPTQDKLVKNVRTGMDGKLTSNVMWRDILGRLLSQLAVIWFLEAEGEMLFDVSDLDSALILNTLIFNLCVFFQIYNMRSFENTVKIDFFNEILKKNTFMCVLIFALSFEVMIAEFFRDRMLVILSQWFLSLLLGFLCMETKLLQCQVTGKGEESVAGCKDLAVKKSDVHCGSTGNSVSIVTGESETTKYSMDRECKSLRDEPTFVADPISQKGYFKEVNEVTQKNEPPLLGNHTMVKHLNPTSVELVAVTTGAENDTPGVNKADVDPSLCREKIKRCRYQGGSPKAKKVDPHVHSSRPSCPSGRKYPTQKSRVEATQINHCGCCII